MDFSVVSLDRKLNLLFRDTEYLVQLQIVNFIQIELK